jgi:hypothetical protein
MGLFARRRKFEVTQSADPIDSRSVEYLLCREPCRLAP